MRFTPRRTRLSILVPAMMLFASVVLIAAPAQAVPPSNGIQNGKYGVLQAFAVQRVPAYPACTSTPTYSPWTVTPNPGALGNPYSEATGGPVALGSNYLMVVSSGVSAKPWGLALFNSSDQELRWNGSSWVTAPGGGFTTEKRFTETGQVYGVSDQGFLHDSGVSMYGTFISPNDALVSSRTYTPNASLNDCVSEGGGLEGNWCKSRQSASEHHPSDGYDDDNLVVGPIQRQSDANLECRF